MHYVNFQFSQFKKIAVHGILFLCGCYIIFAIGISILDWFTHPTIKELFNISDDSVSKLQNFVHIFRDFSEKLLPGTQENV